MYKGDPGFVTNPARQPSVFRRRPLECSRPENTDWHVTRLESKLPVLVTRLKTSVTWAKSTKLVTLTVKPFAIGHKL